MRYACSAILGVALVACSSVQPVPIRAGDVCHQCGRAITEVKLGAQMIGTSGESFTFRTPGCMAKYLAGHSEGIKALFVTDYPSGKMISVSNALFVRGSIDQQTGEHDYYAFRSVNDAAKKATDELSAAIDWSAVRSRAAAESKGN